MLIAVQIAKWRQIKNKIMIRISNHLFIDFLRLNNLATDVRNQELSKQMDDIIISLGGIQIGAISTGRGSEDGDPFGFPKTSMSYNFPESQLENLVREFKNKFI